MTVLKGETGIITSIAVWQVIVFFGSVTMCLTIIVSITASHNVFDNNCQYHCQLVDTDNIPLWDKKKYPNYR